VDANPQRPNTKKVRLHEEKNKLIYTYTRY